MGRTYQPAGESNHSNGGLGRLGDVQEVVEKGLVLMVSKQVKFIQNEEGRTAAVTIAWTLKRGNTGGSTTNTTATLQNGVIENRYT